MMPAGRAPAAPGFVRTVWLLLKASGRRAAGRRARQRALLRQRSGKPSRSRGVVGFALTLLVMAFLNVAAGFATIGVVIGGEQIDIENRGMEVVEPWFAQRAALTEQRFLDAGRSRDDIDEALARICRTEAWRLARQQTGGDAAEIETRLRRVLHQRGAAGLVIKKPITASLRDLPASGLLPALLGSLVLFWWSGMLILQGEGLELDIQRRRHPMWEWLSSHPVLPGAVFLAEMLAPIAANPIYCSAPLFGGVLYGFLYGPWPGVAAAFLVGVPVTLAASCLGKAVEIGIMLRFAPRSRGALIGLMGWLGYVAMMLFFFSAFAPTSVLTVASHVLGPLTVVPWPWLGLFLGQETGGGFSFLRGMATCWAFAAASVAMSVTFSVWAAGKGLTAPADAPVSMRVRPASFGKHALYRKEALWFARDRSAIVQAILVPLTLAGFQLINLRHLAAQAQGAWNTLCGAAILLGTYFLWVLGPKSLASEGAALWIATTWPHGLEALLKAKAWLWSLLSCVIVGIVLFYTVYLFPANWWQVALVGIGWFLFARSMAAKAVTLAVIVAESGETGRVPRGRRMAAQLGMLTFCIGVITQRFGLAITGIVFSMMTAAAMWQNFRARLPYLFDPWSEELPPAPTLMHAMIAISLLVEAGAAVTGAMMPFAGREKVAVLQAAIYGVCAVAVSAGTWWFLRGGGVAFVDVWFWPQSASRQTLPWGTTLRAKIAKFDVLLPYLAGAVLGVALGLFAHAYLALLNNIPALNAQLHRADSLIESIPHLRASIFVMAVFIAPLAEELLFRGLLYRALDHEWGGWRAVLGSAAFFASYHPVLSWLPVSLLGALNAFLFKRTRQLGPSIITHMIYNVVVLS